jgi:glycosyltransferase involved in cell wall biosynthesis
MSNRVLIIGVSFNDDVGVGITLRNLFSSIQPNQIGIIDYSVTHEDFKFAKSIFNIGSDKEIAGDINCNEIKSVTKKKWIEKIKVNFLILALLSLRKYLSYYYNNFSKFNITPNLKKFIADFKPDFLYVVPYNGRIIDLTLRLSILYNIPIVAHFMDDFRKRSPSDVFYYLNEFLTRQRIKRIVEKSYKCLAICESMAKEYEKILNKQFYFFHNPINTDVFKMYKFNAHRKDPHVLRIVYTGTIAENNVDTLIMFSCVCERLSAGENKFYFDIYSPHNKSNIFYQRLVKSIQGYNYTAFKGRVAHSEIVPTLFNYNLLMLPLSFKKRYHSVIEFSFPTKVAEYKASGIPTLYILPPGIALHDYIKKHEIGFLIDQLDAARIEAFLLSFINDPGLQGEDLRAKEIAYRSFDIVEVASKFEKIFS